MLLSRGADVNCRDHHLGQSALHFAAERGHLDCVKYLMEKNADVSITNHSMKTALDKAILKNQLMVVHLLEDVCEKQLTAKPLR